MKRKVSKIGPATLMVSLPSKWVKKYGVKKGDEINLEEEGAKLVLDTSKGLQVKEITVDVSNLTPRLADRFLARAYQKGYDKLIIKFDKPELMIAIQNKVPELLGYEIMDQKKDRLEIRTISSKLDLDFDVVLRKALLIILDMGEECLNAFKKNDKTVLENLHYKDLDVNKSCYFCLRAINKGQHAGFGTYILYYLVELLEDVGDDYKALAKILAKIKKRNQDIISLLTKVNELTRLGYDFFYSPKNETAVSAINLHNKIKEMIKSSLKNKEPDEISAIMLLSALANSVYHLPTMRLDTLKELSGES